MKNVFTFKPGQTVTVTIEDGVPESHPPVKPTLPSLDWDARLDAINVKLVRATVTSGEVWRAIKGVYFPEGTAPGQAQGQHGIGVDLLDKQGKRVIGHAIILKNGGEAPLMTEAKPGEPYAVSLPLSNDRPAYSFYVPGSAASDLVTGLGLEPPHHHVAYGFVLQLTDA